MKHEAKVIKALKSVEKKKTGTGIVYSKHIGRREREILVKAG